MNNLMTFHKSDIIVYQAKNGAIELRADYKQETIWASINEISELFNINKSNVSRHINNIFADKEIIRNSTVAKLATVQKTEGNRIITRHIEYYSLDIILAVGYRARSAKKAIEFRKWASSILKRYITSGYVINPSRIDKNYQAFLQAVEDVKKLLPAGDTFKADEAIDLVKMFASTWFSLDAYDKETFAKTGASRQQVEITAEELVMALTELKTDLIRKNETTELFGNEKEGGHFAGIVGNVFQSVCGRDAYPTQEEKAAHLLYFIIKNHPFTDGNKRSGAFAFVWFLRKAKLLDPTRLTPEALTTLALLIAESDPKEKNRMIGVVLLLLRKTSAD